MAKFDTPEHKKIDGRKRLFSWYARQFFFAISVAIVLLALASNDLHAQQVEPAAAQPEIAFDEMISGFPARTVRNGNVELHVRVGGTGPALYLLHGFPQTGYMWRFVMGPLSENYTVVVPDLRGFGESSKPIEGYDKATLAGDIIAIMDALGHDRAIMVGQDWGGSRRLLRGCGLPRSGRIPDEHRRDCAGDG
ncbi:MAG: alpha/beta fold hydrolase [Pseudomonadota bacterium]